MSGQRQNVIWSYDPAGNAAWNMAYDEAVYLAGEQRSEIWVRCYRWRVASLSLGYFSKLAEVDCGGGRDLVRRMTGGGVVEHGRDFTFSVSIPGRHGWARMRGAAIYEWVHRAASEALGLIRPGVGYGLAQQKDVVGGDGGRCFERPVAADVLAEGRKVVGGAMKRGREGVIYQGSVQVDGLGEEFGRVLVELLAAGGSVRKVDGMTEEMQRATEFLVRSRYGTREWLERS